MSQFATFSTPTGVNTSIASQPSFVQEGRHVYVEDIADFTLYDITGQQIKQVQGATDIYLEQLLKGIYIIEVKQQYGTVKKKLVIAD